MNRIYSSISTSLESRIHFSKESFQIGLGQFKGRLVELIKDLGKLIMNHPAKAAKMAGTCLTAIIFFFVMKKSFEKLSKKENSLFTKEIKEEESPTKLSQVTCKAFESNIMISNSQNPPQEEPEV